MLHTLIDHDKTACCTLLKEVDEQKLWDVFLENQAALFFNAELQWLSKNDFWMNAEHILEIGSGNGAYLHRLSSTFSEKTYVGIEKVRSFVKKANEVHSRDNIAFQEGDATILNHNLIHSFDVVLFRFTLQHLQDPVKTLHHAAQYLSSNGYILIIESYDRVKRTSHPIVSIDTALQLVEEIQKKGQGNRKISFEVLKALKNKQFPLSDLYTTAFSSLDGEENILEEPIRFGKELKKLYANHALLFLELLHRTYHIPVDCDTAYNELKKYLEHEDAWTVPGMHFLLLKKKM